MSNWTGTHRSTTEREIGADIVVRMFLGVVKKTPGVTNWTKVNIRAFKRKRRSEEEVAQNYIMQTQSVIDKGGHPGLLAEKEL